MDKKQIAKLTQTIVERIENERGLDEKTARGMVGAALSQGADALIASIQAPTFLAPAPVAAAPAPAPAVSEESDD